MYKMKRTVVDNYLLISNITVYKFNRKSTSNQKIEMLIVKNKQYAWVSLHCISSLLRYNAGSIIHINADDETYGIVKSLVKLIDSKRIVVSKVEQPSLPPLWQKAKIILMLQGSKKVFIDADLRWNSTIPSIPKGQVLIFSKEFNMVFDSKYRSLLVANGWEVNQEIYMLNTSVLCWNGLDQKILVNDFLNLLFEFERLNMASLGFDTSQDVTRLSEQITLSYFLRNFQIAALDEILIRDKCPSVESTYFGATGHRFGR
jgi:hypothetical protein